MCRNSKGRLRSTRQALGFKVKRFSQDMGLKNQKRLGRTAKMLGSNGQRGMGDTQPPPASSELTAASVWELGIKEPNPVSRNSSKANLLHRPSHCRHIKVRNIIHDNQSPLRPGFLSSLCGGIMTFPPVSGKIIEMKWKIFSYLS